MQVGVILSPPRCVPGNWDALRCDQDNAARILVNAGVKLGLANSEFSYITNLRWEAAMIMELSGLSYQQALATVTSNVASFFGLDAFGVGKIEAGQPANFVIYDGDPMTLDSRVLAVAIKNSVTCGPTHPIWPINH